MSCKQRPFLVKYNLSACFEISLEKICMLFSENGGHQYVNRVPNNFGFAVSEYFREALTSLQNFSYRLFISTKVNNSSIIIEENFMRFSYIIEIFLASIGVKTSFNILITMSCMISNVFKILTIDVKSVWIVRINLAEHVPEHIDFLRSLICFLTQIVKDVKIGDYSSEMSPKLDLKIAYFFNCTLHLSKQSFKFYNIW